MKKIGILGSTGSIGTQALKLIKENPDKYELVYLTAGKNEKLLSQQALEFNLSIIAIALSQNESTFPYPDSLDIRYGIEGIVRVIQDNPVDLIISAIVGFAGVIPTYTALNTGTDVALANKESLVSAGELITGVAKDNDSQLIAVDSEHSAILQSLAGEDPSCINKMILTASGGPFREKSKDEFASIRVKDALNHPNWSMGDKITIDSATLMNKGLEVIEAKWLFDIPAERIEVVVHPQSIIHSMVEFCDGSIKAQLGIPDMAVPIAYALSKPSRLEIKNNSLDWTKIRTLDFQEPDLVRFPCLKLAFEALGSGSGYCNAMNAANEVAVSSFLNEKIGFTDIPDTIKSVLDSKNWESVTLLDSVLDTDKQARIIANDYIRKIS